MIKLTKKLPTDWGWYYWTEADDEVPMIVGLGDGGIYIWGEHREPSDLGGYWAKVDQSMFEVVDDES